MILKFFVSGDFLCRWRVRQNLSCDSNRKCYILYHMWRKYNIFTCEDTSHVKISWWLFHWYHYNKPKFKSPLWDCEFYLDNMLNLFLFRVELITVPCCVSELYETVVWRSNFEGDQKTFVIGNIFPVRTIDLQTMILRCWI